MEEFKMYEDKSEFLDLLEETLKISNKWKSSSFMSEEIRGNILNESQSILDKVHAVLGIVGSTYVIVNKRLNKIDTYQGKRLKESNIKNKPFNSDNVFPSIKKENKLRNGFDIIELLAEGKRESEEISESTSFANPEFFKFLKTAHVTGENYLYCEFGETLFYIYTWLWLIRYAQFDGLHSVVEYSNKFYNKQPCYQIEDIYHELKQEITDYGIIDNIYNLTAPPFT